MRIQISLILLCLSLAVWSQKIFQSEYPTIYTLSENQEMNVQTGTYVLSVQYDEESLQFSSYEGEEMTYLDLKEANEKYVLGKIYSSYGFYDVEKKQFIYIDLFGGKFTVFGYGTSEGLKDRVEAVMKKLLENRELEEGVAFLKGQM